MVWYIFKRLIFGLITIIGISIIIFSIIHLLPGDPIQIMFGENQNLVLVEKARQFYGLDKPIIIQYFSWINNLFHGNLGYSIVDNRPVTELIIPRIGRTITLAFFGLLFSLIIAIPSGIISAWKHNTWLDFNITTVSYVLISIPEFWLGILYMIIFSVWLGVLPTSGYISPTVSILGWFKILLLPALTIASVLAAQTTRMIRANMLEILNLDYITLMKASGVKNTRLLFIHAFRNASIPVLTLIGIQVGYLLGGVIIVERVFTYPGLGLLLIKSISERDYAVVQACILIYSIFFVLINIVIDLAYTFINPKIRY